MIKLKTKIFTLLSVLVLILANFPAAAMADSIPLKATNFQVSIQPEYDDPRTLVIYQGDMYATGSDVVKKGTPISFIIPKGASQQKLHINMACEINSQGGHDCQPYTTKDLGNGQLQLSWKLSKDVAPSQKYPVYLEFYYDNGSVAPNKSFSYNFKPTFNIDSLNFTVTQPKTATNFALNPTATGTGKDSNGLNTYSLDLTNKTPKDTIPVKISYTKADNTPTFNKPQVGSQTQNQNQAGTPSLGNNLIKPAVLIPILLFVVAMGFLFTYALKNPQHPKQASNFQAVRKNNKPKTTASPKNNATRSEKSKLRQALLDGKISEETYKEIMADLGTNEK